MLDAAVRMSLKTAMRSNCAGPSSSDVTRPHHGIVSRAVAAELRLSKKRKRTTDAVVGFDDEENIIDDASSLSSGETSLSKGKRKLTGTPKPAKKVALYPKMSEEDHMSIDEWKKQETEHLRYVLSTRRAIKKEERVQAARLGRNLTHVS